MGKPEEQEARVRPLAAAGLSTYQIADLLGDMSQTTVVRVLKRINTGPHPLVQPDDDPTYTYPAADPYGDPPTAIQPALPAPVPPAQRTPVSKIPRESHRIRGVVVAVMIVLAAIVAGAVWYRLTQVPAPAETRIAACALYASDGQITKITMATSDHCGAGWQFLVLTHRNGSP